MRKRERVRHAALVAATKSVPLDPGIGKSGRHAAGGRHFTDQAATFVVERIEARLLLSAVLHRDPVPHAAPVPQVVAHPTFVAYHPSGFVAPYNTPFDTSSPTGLTPAQMRHAYGVDQINFNGVTGDGTGQTIALVDAFDQPNAASDLNAFSQYFNLPLMNQPGGPTFTKIDENGGTNYPPTDTKGGWGVEISLDIEWAHSIAPGANILLVEAASASNTDLLTAVDTARSYAGVSAVSMSWGAAEFSGESSYDSHFVTPAGHTPVSFFSSTGDSGEPGGWPAYSPNVVAVGGTTLNVDSSGNYISETGWSDSGGGISTEEPQPAYQSGVVTQSSTARTIPDIAMDADPNTGVPVYDTYDFETSTPWAQYGGTSLASPMAAAEVAIADQGDMIQNGTTLDGPSATLPTIYSMAASNFHDITSGNNGYPAGVGYDLVTGIGSPANSFALTLSGFDEPRLKFAAQPTSTTAGATISTVTVDVLQANGQLNINDDSNVTLALSGGGTLNGTVTVAAINGVATFNTLSINLAGSYNLDATDGTLGAAVSSLFSITPGTAKELGFVQQPTGVSGGATISPPVTVAVEDMFGNVVTGDTSAVTLAIASGPGTLGGTLTQNASGGVATFGDLSIQTPGAYTLLATDGTLLDITSASFKIAPPPARVVSIDRMSPPGPYTSDTSVEFNVLFNEVVTGVSAGDFTVVLNGVTVAAPLIVVGSGANYTVTVNGISAGRGTLGLNLVDNGTIRDVGGNPLQGGGDAAFHVQSTFGTGGKPSSVAVADVNGDGIPDLIVANYGSNSVSVLLGNGNGTFQPQKTFATGSGPMSVAVADVNGDGKPDLVVANDGSSTVSVLLGNGNGTFLPQKSFATGYGPISVAVTDVNGDGKPDLIVTNGGSYYYPGDTVSVLLGNGDGTFKTQQTFATGYIPASVAVADINGDGKPDLVIANYGVPSLYGSNLPGTVSVLLGNGNGTFKPQQTFGAGDYPQFVTVSDVNGDGKPDLIVANTGSYYSPGYNVSVLLGNGNGTFQTQQIFDTGNRPASVAVADANGDGKPDLIVANYSSNSVSVLLGNGNGTFQSQQIFATGKSPDSVAVSDVNEDGRPDLVVANSGSKSVSVLLCSSNGNFTGQTYTVVPDLDTITGTTGVDQITLVQDPDGQHIDWTINGSAITQTLINDPNGLTIIGGGSNDVITLDYTRGDPLPNKLNLNGIFTLNNLASTGNPLANTSIDLETSTLFINYGSPANDPLSLIKGYLKAGYNNGTWTGTSSNGLILSSSAAANVNQTTAIGYVDSADGMIPTLPPTTIELAYVLYGDTSLQGAAGAYSVGFTDFMRLTQHYNTNTGATWDQGDFNYDGSVNSADFTLLKRTYGTTLGAQAAPPTSSATAISSVPPNGSSSAKAKSKPKLVTTVAVKPARPKALARKSHPRNGI